MAGVYLPILTNFVAVANPNVAGIARVLAYGWLEGRIVATVYIWSMNSSSKFSLSGWRLAVALVVSFILGIITMIAFAFAVGDDEESSFTDQQISDTQHIREQFEN